MLSACADLPSEQKHAEQTGIYQHKRPAKGEIKVFPVSHMEPLNSGCLHRRNIKRSEETALESFPGFFVE